MLERRKDILTPNWAFLPDVIRRPKKELKRKLLSHYVIQCDVMPYPYSIEKSFSHTTYNHLVYHQRYLLHTLGNTVVECLNLVKIVEWMAKNSEPED